MSLIQNKDFLKLSDINILRLLRDLDRISILTHKHQCSIQFLKYEFLVFHKKCQFQENKIIRNLGGLYIIGTERNESRRVDNQLRGRCARLGDPGSSQFFLSLDDNLLRLFGGPKIQNLMQNQSDVDSPLESPFLTKSLNKAQERIEERAYQQRKNLFEYDDVLNKQRNIVYYERRQILESICVKENIFAYGEQIITDILLEFKKKPFKIQKAIELIQLIENLFGKKINFQNWFDIKSGLDDLKLYLFQEFWLAYLLKKLEFSIYGEKILESLERTLILINTDKIWREHLQRMNLLKESVGWRGYGQRNPLYEYKQEAFYSFETREELLRQLVIYDLLRSSIL
jgi:preprotein translocase subunit SecA